MRKEPFSKIVDYSINQTLSRTVLTSGTTILSTLAIYLFGGAEIKDFAFILLIGFVVGVYSSVFVASALVVELRTYKPAPAPVKLAKK